MHSLGAAGFVPTCRHSSACFDLDMIELDQPRSTVILSVSEPNAAIGKHTFLEGACVYTHRPITQYTYNVRLALHSPRPCPPQKTLHRLEVEHQLSWAAGGRCKLGYAMLGPHGMNRLGKAPTELVGCSTQK